MVEPTNGVRLLSALRERLALEGLHIALPLGDVEILREVAPFARSAVVVGDGGGEFFARFSAAETGDERNPLDAYTRRRVMAVVDETLGGAEIAFEVFFPFATEKAHLPFQRLGQAAGLPAPGPFGVQVHPIYGPWWAYRALVVLALPLAGEAGLEISCTDCRGPCVNDCEVHRTHAGRWVRGARLGPIVCGDACGARVRCPVGSPFRYPAEQIAFHARARRAAAGGA